MSQRDEFLIEIKRDLAARAGHKCSLCQKSTSGPSADFEDAISDGVAAHITAASPGGPRFDASLTPEERRSAENGIWACTQCGREIDADANAFSIDLLRGLKRIREEAAATELHSHLGRPDQTAGLIEFPHANTAFKLFEIVAAQPYTYPTTAAIRELIQRAKEPTRLMNLTAEVIPSIWKTHANVAGILSTLLSTASDLWQPAEAILLKLEELCNSAIQVGDWSQVASVEPLAFALGAKGHHGIHRRVLERLIEERHWRNADSTRIQEYYGTVGVQITAILRHWHDPFRKGLLRVNDVARLMDLLLSSDQTLSTLTARQTALDLLDQHALALKECGEVTLAARVDQLAAGLRHVAKS